ncbi:hypothetical protein IV38_GL001386 [Lactobacillus selangorensis]|uniref:Major facilitator superfamily (MFS) profile domain-containing protein n=1 Tax=Lactobacillus selangorensis TaxID=81857 RepID=A0A0R2FU10_9LACO|nr:DHA2 family efflux MFS transporter permease subunit [Lactobacillus selangorensis]KRN28386.1 hypothetical protein IV38_GL001386 [Lactobacillus selangorensis]KRN31887.1 hypothetical protein IV40_GL001173 [Lactobacillus selangorensis]
MNQNQTMSKKDLVAILAAALMSFVGILIETSMNVTFPTLIKQFHITLSVAQWVGTGYLLMVSLVIICSAYIKMRFKEKNIFVTGVIFAVIGDLICALAPNFWILLFGRLVQAGGTGIVLPLLFNIILERAPLSRRGLFMGLGGLIVSMAPALGPTFGGIVVYFLGWRDIFWIVLPFMIVALFLGWFSIDQVTKLSHPKFDWLRLALLTVMLVSLTLGFNTVGTLGWLNFEFLFSLVVFALATWAFIAASQHSDRMLVNIKVFTLPVFTLSLIAYFLIQFTNIGSNFILPNYAQLVDHSTTLISGLILLPGSLLAGMLNPLFGKMLDDLGPKRPITWGNTIFAIALIAFIAFSLHMSPMMIMLMYIVFAIGMSMSFANTMTFALGQVPIQYEADANAIFNTLQQFGGSIGTAIASSFLASGSGATTAARTASGTQHAFIFFFVLICLNFIFYHYAFKLKPKEA